jgi:ABC-type multidrug transport system ATPase subunit
VPVTAVLAAGVGARRGWAWPLRAASFRLESPLTGQPALGILVAQRGMLAQDDPLAGGGLGAQRGGIAQRGAATAVIDLLAGLVSPSYGELRVLGEDMRTERGRAAARARIGVVRRGGRPRPGVRIRGLVEHAARRTRLPRRDRTLLAAAILDRLALLPWADVPLRAVPDPVARRARLAAAAVHQPELLLIDGLLDGLSPADAAVLAACIRDIGRDTGVVAAGHDADPLTLSCGEVLTLADGILVG